MVPSVSHPRPKRRRRVVAAAFAVTTAAWLLTGCETVTPAGGTGISIDSHGRPVIVFAVCSGHIDAATIYRDRKQTDQKGTDPYTVDVANWDAMHAITPDTAARRSLNTATSSSQWQQTGTTEEMRPGVRYTAMGATRDNTYYTSQVEFTLDHLAALKPGEVLSQADDETADHDPTIIQPYEKFKQASCS